MANSENTLVKIYKVKNKTSTPKNLIPLQINNNQIRFFQDVLTKECEFTTDGEKWWLIFFKNSSFEQIFCIDFYSLPKLSSDEKSWEECCKNIHDHKLDYQKFVEVSKLVYLENIENSLDEELLANYASYAIRQSKAVKYSSYTQTKYNTTHLDGKGFSFITSLENQKEHFERKILLLTLGYAYLHAIQELYNKLADIVGQNINNLENLTKIYISAAEFNARYYFYQPVKIDRTSLTEDWHQIENKLEISNNNNELEKQINNIHYIIELQTSKEIEKREQKRNWLIGIFGLIISIISLLDLLK